MIKAIIFDMDGVLIDSEPYYQKILLRCLKHFQINATSDDLLALAGGTTQHYNQVINPLLVGHVSRAEFDCFNKQYYLNHPTPYPDLLFPHVKDILNLLKENGYKIAIASSSKQCEIKQVLKMCQLENMFTLIMSGDMFQESKPNPEIYKTCVKKLNLRPNECISIEDSEYGILASLGANITCIAKKDSRFGYDQGKAHYIIQDLMEIMEILEKINHKGGRI